MTLLEETEESLERIQSYDVQNLPRREELGARFSFDEVVDPAGKVINLFRNLPEKTLQDFPDPILQTIKQQSDQVFNLFDQVLNFDETQPEATSQRQNIITSITNLYDSIFPKLYPLITYSMSKTVDFNRLEEEARATIQSINDQTNKTIQSLDKSKESASSILEEVRKTAAEQGVSQQAIFFSDEAKSHNDSAQKWRKRTQNWFYGLIAYGVLTFFLHKIPFIAPTSLPESIQFTLSKGLIFFGILFMLILSARNFMSHRHNEVINKHRQNALQTFRALADAGGTSEARDVVLNHAASSIFSPQDTGYAKASSQNTGNVSNSVIEMIPKSSVRISE
ncbi:hypothetical protein [Thalassospira lucentensis]|uniref:hypothetical protein n=1 Tax=Thalassospira lucentensis TaxID=168935 RepID=UPI0003B34EC6|nr:hypothetical protein [Thalassospira lucentensis]RCK21994.1 hypothetical protein TH1_17825 [Thalassospira lucentensis MCCC 1A00383 = DSM 14000]